jgi:ribosomal protein S18 acetylase RimI-like enzyme
MSAEPVEISEVAPSERERLLPILEESFEGLYLWHSRRTLNSISLVKAARVAGEDAGVAMLKTVASKAGYVYYIAVAKRFRGKGIGGRLLDDALALFSDQGMEEVYASVEEENVESNALFSSRGFERMTGNELADEYGRVRAFIMAREMMVVRGEVLLRKKLGTTAPTEP